MDAFFAAYQFGDDENSAARARHKAAIAEAKLRSTTLGVEVARRLAAAVAAKDRTSVLFLAELSGEFTCDRFLRAGGVSALVAASAAFPRDACVAQNMLYALTLQCDLEFADEASPSDVLLSFEAPCSNTEKCGSDPHYVIFTAADVRGISACVGAHNSDASVLIAACSLLEKMEQQGCYPCPWGETTASGAAVVGAVGNLLLELLDAVLHLPACPTDLAVQVCSLLEEMGGTASRLSAKFARSAVKVAFAMMARHPGHASIAAHALKTLITILGADDPAEDFNASPYAHMIVPDGGMATLVGAVREHLGKLSLVGDAFCFILYMVRGEGFDDAVRLPSQMEAFVASGGTAVAGAALLHYSVRAGAAEVNDTIVSLVTDVLTELPAERAGFFAAGGLHGMLLAAPCALRRPGLRAMLGMLYSLCGGTFACATAGESWIARRCSGTPHLGDGVIAMLETAADCEFMYGGGGGKGGSGGGGAVISVSPALSAMGRRMVSLAAERGKARAAGTCVATGCKRRAVHQCAGCLVTGYCGKACQTADWKGGSDAKLGVYSHKLECPVLQFVGAGAGAPAGK